MTEETVTAKVAINRRINGEVINLTDGRAVFVGRVAGVDGVFIRLVNAEGKNTDIRISEEAAHALQALLSGKEESGSEDAFIELPEIAQWSWVPKDIGEANWKPYCGSSEQE